MSARRRRTNYSGWAVRDRDGLLAALAEAGCVPVHRVILAEHVTYRYPDTEPAPAGCSVRVVGWVSDSLADVAVVEVDGCRTRPDGRFYHLTVALCDGAAPKVSNTVLADAERSGAVLPVPAIEVVCDAF